MRALWFAMAALGVSSLLFVPGNVMTASRAIRNNNPGNLRFYSIGWRGETGADPDGFSIFDSMEHGVRAAYINMRTKYFRDGIQTIAQLVPVWAPAHENNVEAYIDFVSTRTGIAPHTPFEFSSSQSVDIIEAIFRFEAGEEIPRDVILNGVAMA